MKISGQVVEELVGGLGPDERLGILVPRLDPSPKVGLQLGDAAVGRAPQLAVGQAGEPALHQVQPGAVGRGQVEVEAGMAQQPSLDLWGLVGPVVVADQVHVQRGRHSGVDGAQELENSWWRWRRCTWEMTLPEATSSAANRLAVPLRT